MAINKKKAVAALLKKAKKALKKPRKPRTPLEKKKFVEKQAKKMASNLTKPEKLFMQICKELKIPIENQKVVMSKIFDFYVPAKNTLVEVDGDYWHGYDLTMEQMNGMQRRAVRNDKKKDMIAVGSGFNIFRIWEHELVDDYESAKEKIRKQFA